MKTTNEPEPDIIKCIFTAVTIFAAVIVAVMLCSVLGNLYETIFGGADTVTPAYTYTPILSPREKLRAELRAKDDMQASRGGGGGLQKSFNKIFMVFTQRPEEERLDQMEAEKARQLARKAALDADLARLRALPLEEQIEETKKIIGNLR